MSYIIITKSSFLIIKPCDNNRVLKNSCTRPVRKVVVSIAVPTDMECDGDSRPDNNLRLFLTRQAVTLGESNIAPRHHLGSKLESLKTDPMEVNWLIHGSELDRELIKMVRTENCLLNPGFKVALSISTERSFCNLCSGCWSLSHVTSNNISMCQLQ